MAIPNCSTCVHRRPIISENGMHYVCGLSWQSASNCIKGNKDRYQKHPKFTWKRINDGFSDLCEKGGAEDGR